MDGLRKSYAAPGKDRLFELLKANLVGTHVAVPYSQVGDELDMTEQAVKNAAHRMRRRYREIVREDHSVEDEEVYALEAEPLQALGERSLQL